MTWCGHCVTHSVTAYDVTLYSFPSRCWQQWKTSKYYQYSNNKTLSSNGQFPGLPGQAGTRMLNQAAARDDGVVELAAVTNRTLRHAKLQSDHNHQHTSIWLFVTGWSVVEWSGGWCPSLQAGCPSCHPTNSVIVYYFITTTTDNNWPGNYCCS